MLSTNAPPRSGRAHASVRGPVTQLWHPRVSNEQFARHASEPPAKPRLTHVCPPTFCPSHCSVATPASPKSGTQLSICPLPQRAVEQTLGCSIASTGGPHALPGPSAEGPSSSGL